MFVAGIPVRDELILKLARLVDDSELASRVEDCYGRDIKVLGLSVPDARRLSAHSTIRQRGSRSCAGFCSPSTSAASATDSSSSSLEQGFSIDRGGYA